ARNSKNPAQNPTTPSIRWLKPDTMRPGSHDPCHARWACTPSGNQRLPASRRFPRVGSGSARSGSRGLHVLGRDVTDVLREVPNVTLGILGAVRAVAVELIRRLLLDGRARLPRAAVVRVDVVDVDVDVLRRLAESLRVPVAGAGMAHHHDAVRELDLAV